MPIDERNYAGGGMDYDSAPEYIAPGDYISAYNLRPTGTEGLEAGYLTNIESNELIPLTLPSGINKCVGSERFEDIRKAYAFIYNSQGRHLLTEFDYDSEQLTLLYTNLDDSNGEDALPLNTDSYVNSIKLVDKNRLAFLNGDGEACLIDVEKLKDRSLGALSREDFLLIKKQPLKLIKADYVNDSTRSVNLLRGKLFQFRSQFIYGGNMQSAYSAMSKREVPEDEGTPTAGTDVSQSNGLKLTIPIGDKRVETINVAARYGSMDWFTIKSIDRKDILSITDTNIDLENEIYEAYDPATETYSFVFYNDGLYPNIDVLETDLDHDYIPRKSADLELINGGILALTNNREGYKRPNVNFTVSSTSYDPQLTIPKVDQSNVLSVTYTQYRPDYTTFRYVFMYFSGTAKQGDSITLRIGNLDGKFLIAYSHTVTSDEDNNTLKAITGLAKELPDAAVSQINSTTVELRFKTRTEHPPNGDRKQLIGYEINLANAGSGNSKSVHGVKSNSSYQVAVAFYDQFGRKFPIYTDNSCVIKTASMAQLFGQAPKIHWDITGTPPDGASSYQILLSQNNTHQRSLYTSAVLDASNSNSDYFVFNINSLKKFNDNNSSSIITYDYSEGDRCTFVYKVESGAKQWYNNPCIDVEVVGFEIKTTTDEITSEVTTDWLLKVRKSAIVSAADITGKNLLLEIYTPKKRVNGDGKLNNDATLFFEVGEQYNVVNGEYSVTSGDIVDGDVYWKTREMPNAANTNILDQYIVEDFNFSDYYKSDYTSYGRPRSYFDTPEDIQSETTIRYSDAYIPLSKINLLNRFYAERMYGNSPGEINPAYGAVRKLRQRDNVLVCFQDLKIGYIPVNSTIMETQDGYQNVTISDKLLNNIRYSPGDIGIGTAVESFAEDSGVFYFIDPYRSEPARADLGGVRYISGKMSKYFKKVLYLAQKHGKKIIGFYDGFNKEYVVSIESEGDVVRQIPFSNAEWTDKENYNPTPDGITITQYPTKGTISYNSTTGKAEYIANHGASGKDSFSFSFNHNGDIITKNVCINIEQGDSDIFDFSFIDIADAELNTTFESNEVLITGNNMPVPISVIGGEYSIEGGSWTSAPGYINPDSSVKVRTTSSSSYGTIVSAVLTVAGKSDSFDVKTKDKLVPDPFSFANKTGVPVSTLTESGSAIITGITAPTAISISAGSYQINGGAWVSTPGTISNNDTVKVRITSSSSPLTGVTTTLTIGGVQATFTVITAAQTITNTSNGATSITVGYRKAGTTEFSYLSPGQSAQVSYQSIDIKIEDGWSNVQVYINGVSQGGYSGTKNFQVPAGGLIEVGTKA